MGGGAALPARVAGERLAGGFAARAGGVEDVDGARGRARDLGAIVGDRDARGVAVAALGAGLEAVLERRLGQRAAGAVDREARAADRGDGGAGAAVEGAL